MICKAWYLDWETFQTVKIWSSLNVSRETPSDTPVIDTHNMHMHTDCNIMYTCMHIVIGMNFDQNQDVHAELSISTTTRFISVMMHRIDQFLGTCIYKCTKLKYNVNKSVTTISYSRIVCMLGYNQRMTHVLVGFPHVFEYVCMWEYNLELYSNIFEYA